VRGGECRDARDKGEGPSSRRRRSHRRRHQKERSGSLLKYARAGRSCSRGGRRRRRRRRRSARPRPPEPDAGRHRDTAWRVLRGDAARADGSTSDSGSDGARAVPVPAPDSLPGEDALPARRRRRRGSGAKQGDDSDSDGRPRRPRRRRVAERKR